MYIVGQDNKMRKCLATSKTQIILRELHEGVASKHFATNKENSRCRILAANSIHVYS